MFKRFKKQTPDTPSSRRFTSKPGPPVFSYYAHGNSPTNQNIGRNDNHEPKKRLSARLRLSGVPTYLALLFVLVVVLYSLWIQPQPNVVVLSQPGTIYQATEAYKKAINSAWGASFGNQFKMSVDAQRVESDIAKAIPDVALVQVQLPLLGRKPTVVLTPGKPALELITSNGGFYIDTYGRVLAHSNQVQQNQLTNVPTVQDETGLRADVGKTILPTDQATYIHQLSRQLTADGLKVQSMTLPANAANEVDVRLNGQGYYIKFATTGDPRQGVGAYLATKKKLESEGGMTPQEYVDVRIDEKVFYK